MFSLPHCTADYPPFKQENVDGSPKNSHFVLGETMNKQLGILLLFAFISVRTIGGHIPQRLVLVGGGHYEGAAIKRFVEWSGGKNAHILFVPWATSEPKESFDRFV